MEKCDLQAERMEAELDVKGLQNLTGPDGKSSYCVRCSHSFFLQKVGVD